MREIRRSTAAALAGLGALALLATPSLADTGHHDAQGAAPAQDAAPTEVAHMGRQGGAPGKMGPGMMGPGMMGPGMMGPGMMGPGMMGPGMMGPGKMGPRMMGPGMMGPGMMGPGQGCPPSYGMGPGMMAPGHGYGPGYGMGPGMTGPGMMGPGFGARVVPERDLTTDDVRHFFEHRLDMHGNKRLKVGEVKESDDDTIIADVVTQDGSLVERLKVDRHSGAMQRVE